MEWKNNTMIDAGKKAWITKLRNQGRNDEADKIEQELAKSNAKSIDGFVAQPLKQIKGFHYDVPCTYVPDANLPWVEKYRPVSLADLIGPVGPYLRAFIKTGKFPLAMVFWGDYGEGKTAGAQCLIRDYYVNQKAVKPEASFADVIYSRQWTEEYEGCWSPVLYVEATLYNDVEMIRDKVRNFMRVRSMWNMAGAKLKKFVLFDEADRLNYQAQGGLRSLIEKYPGTVTIYTTNRIESIDPAIRSRASGGIFNFVKSDKEALMKHLQNILAREELDLKRETLEEIAVASESVRDAVGKLQQEAMVNC
jgi:DNA polymerase III delta prime subunit